MLLAVMLACNGDPEGYENPVKVPGTPIAGAAEGVLDAPMGAPMGGYSSRCKILGHESKPDKRLSPYTVAFAQSAGFHTRPKVKAIWLENGDDTLVLLKFDGIYSFDGLVTEIEDRLSAELGRNLTGKVLLAASHSHAMPANFSDQPHFYLGGDKFNREVFERYVRDMTAVALEAHDVAEPAAIGANWLYEWDPDDRVYRDRRGENDTLQVWDDQEPGKSKDEHALILRVDSEAGDPLAMAVVFGMHGTILDGDTSLWSHDSTGGLEVALEEQFDDPDFVVMHLQGAGGDASPGGSDDSYARTETIGVYAVDALMDGWLDTPTSSDAIDLEVAARHIPSHRDDIRVTRDGTVDWYYPPYEEGFESDNVIYDDDGSLMSPFDEYAVFEFGAAFCGSEDPLLKVEAQADVYPYTSCMDVGLLSGLIAGTFGMIVEDFPLPMEESLKAGTLGVAIDGIPVRGTSGVVGSEESLVLATFPAEPASMFTEQFRRRAVDELGIEIPGAIGYAQDHEGYYLIPEDWLVGGYEPNINVWGPLQGEHVMEGVLTMTKDVLLTDEREDPDPLGWWSPTTYEAKDFVEFTPDDTPDAGTRLSAEDLPEDFWVPPGFAVDLEVPETCERVDCVIQIAWQGGDPAVDMPSVRLQHSVGGAWQDMTSSSGRPIDEAGHDILVAWTPDPLYPVDVDQDHLYWAAWQAVGHYHDRMELPAGDYRLVVDGVVFTGSETHWPFTAGASYSLESETFTLVPATVRLEAAEGGVWAWIDGPAEGWRLVDIEGSSTGANPIRGVIDVAYDDGSGTTVEVDTISGGKAWIPLDPSDGATAVTITDTAGNTGIASLE